MMRKSRPRQLLFAFAESPQGDGCDRRADVSALTSQPAHTAKSSQRSESTPPRTTEGYSHLLELVTNQSNLETALANVARNKGAPGVDKQTVAEVMRRADHLLPTLRHALLSESYVPGDIRRAWIPKPGGGQRGLGIPTVTS